jgi:hypothetical protein
MCFVNLRVYGSYAERAERESWNLSYWSKKHFILLFYFGILKTFHHTSVLSVFAVYVSCT